ncbi:2-C-methyl-D-erythritol 4-phosphate cytidylyltransferase, partial [Campylobacter jejuni]|nr:2-C-methyl-D-erythritol 4-phosphate cytidylyltransferase [Campylobacter jejuni]
TRAESLKKALKLIDSEFVMVSDVARVLVSKNLFDRFIENLDKADCITHALKVADTTLFDNEALQREKIKLIPTPQISKTKLLNKALDQNLEVTD